jgi:hypothetical protein
MATDMAATNKSAEGLSGAFRQAALTVVGVEKVFQLVQKMAERTQTMQAIQMATNAQNLTRLGLRTREMNLDNEIYNLTEKLRDTNLKNADIFREQLRSMEGELNVLQHQKVFAAELERIGHGRLTTLLIFKAAALDMFLKERGLNQNLIEANSHWRVRAELLRETLMTEAQLGIGFGEITKSAQALVHYSLDTEKSFAENVRLVAMMEQGLGVSASESARLATIVERQLGGAFKGVADTISQLVNDTALAGDEAARLATSIGTIMGRMRPGMGGQALPEVLKLVGRYESALKEVGGAPGAFQHLLDNLTRPEGMLGAGALGVNPEFINTAKGVQDVMDRFGKYGEQLLGQSQGWTRQMQLQNLAEIFHVSADQANQMLYAIKRARNAQSEQISVQDRWREQLHATNSGINRLANSLLALLNGAMYPVVFAVGAITNKLADWLEKLMESRALVYTVSGVLFAGFVVLTAQMWRLATSLWAVVASSKLAAAGMARLAVMNTAAAAARFGSFVPMSAFQVFLQNLTRFSGPGGATTFAGRWLQFPTLSAGIGSIGVWLSRIGATLRAIAIAVGFGGAVVGAVVAGTGYLAYLGIKQYNEMKRLREESHQLEIINASKFKDLEQKRDMRIYQMARDLRPGNEVLAQYRRKTEDILAQNLTPEMTREKLAEAAKATIDAVDKGITAKLTFKPLKDRTPEEQAHSDELYDLTDKIYDENKKAVNEAVKRRTLQETMQRENEVERLKNRSILHGTKGLPGSESIGDWLYNHVIGE